MAGGGSGVSWGSWKGDEIRDDQEMVCIILKE